MDPQSSEKIDIQELIRLSHASRAHLTYEIGLLQQKLDLPARLHDSLKSSPSKWLLGSVVSGLVASLVLRRPKSTSAPTKPKGIARHLLSLSLTAAQPIAKIWITQKLQQFTNDLISRNKTSAAPFEIINVKK